MAAAVNACQFSLIDCLKLVDWNKPITQTDKKGAIPGTTLTILQHLNMDAKHREIVAEKERYALKEPEITYSTHFDSKKRTLSSENTIILE